MIALTRGQNSNFPCPVCLVPKESLTTYSVEYEIRTTQRMKEAVTSARAQRTQRLGEEILSRLGLRDADVSITMNILLFRIKRTISDYV